MANALPKPGASWFNLEGLHTALANNRQIVPAFKTALAEASNLLDSEFAAGEDIEALVHGRALLID